MDYKGLLGFLLNNELLTLDEIYKPSFSLEKRDESNLLFYVNNRVDNDAKNDTKLVVKVLKNPSTGRNLLLREAKFFEFFSFSQQNPKNLLSTNFGENDIKGLYQNNTIFVRKFVGNYTDAFRYLKNHIEIDLNQFVQTIAERMAGFHEFLDANGQAELIKFLSNYFVRSEVHHNPIFFNEILPLSKFKFAPPYIQQFWNVINQQSVNVEKLFDKLKENINKNGSVKLIHGDFRLKNILFKDEEWSKKPDSFLIDYEQWHLGDIALDIATFFNTFPLYKASIPYLSNITVQKEDFYTSYFTKTKYSADEEVRIKKRVECLQKIIKIQNSYANIAQNGQNRELVKQEIASIINILQS
jgi:thiamine kinase-like enzyme